MTAHSAIDFVLFDGSMNGNVADTVITTTDWSVVKIPINPVDETYKSTVTIGIDDIDLTTDFISDLYPHEQIEEFVFLSLRNGWRSLTCTSNLTSILDVSQNTYEKQQQFEYYDANNIATTEVWRSIGMKRFKVATGFMPEQMIDQLLQDFVLSPKKFKWDSVLGKFILVLI